MRVLDRVGVSVAVTSVALAALAFAEDAFAAETPATESVVIPPDEAITIDGALSEGEWANATLLEHGGVELLLSRSEDALQVGVRTPGLLVVSLCLRRDDAVHVLHASAALGRAIYRPSESTWSLVEPFEWAVRTTELTDEANAERRAYFEANEWVSSTTRMGAPGETEMRISAEYLDPNGARVSLGVMIQDEEGVRVTGLPLGADADASTTRALIGGPPPDEATFDVESWTVLRLE